jgi:hypothetical protein
MMMMMVVVVVVMTVVVVVVSVSRVALAMSVRSIDICVFPNNQCPPIH